MEIIPGNVAPAGGRKLGQPFGARSVIPYSLLLAAGIVAAALLFLLPHAAEFPMDDAYIHLVYARNLAEHGSLDFNFPGERGVGSTSLLWVLLLAAGLKVGIPMAVLAKALGIASLIALSLGVQTLLRSIWGPLPAFLAAALVGISGNMLWFALSGMETVLFLALGIAVLIAYRSGRAFWVGLALAALILTRPEGIALLAAIWVVDVLHHRRVTRGLLMLTVLAVGLSAPWFVYLYLRSGHFISTSAIGKHLSTSIAIDHILRYVRIPESLAGIPGLLYILMWIGFLGLHVLGGVALPPPLLTVETPSLGTYGISYWSVFAWVLAAGLILVSARQMLSPGVLQTWFANDSRRALLLMLIWVVLHNLAYALYLPIPGTASRYGAINHVVLWLSLSYGLLVLGRRRPRLFSLAIPTILLAVVNTLYWNSVYDANLEHMTRVRIRAADFVRVSIPADENCAAFDVGAMRYFGGHPVIDLGGLIDPNAAEVFEAGTTDQYLLSNKVTCLILPGRSGEAGDGLFDFGDILGISTSPVLHITQLETFAIDRRTWLRGYLATGNYQASVVVYDVRPVPVGPAGLRVLAPSPHQAALVPSCGR
ncbi:MAG TPA: hypothetical protein VIU38_05745 [Anaerolineales bacterium]